tara:strand:- start:1039 stop:1221 length:183 start_codon:yes stop_codon:yes gene_type:complete
MTGSLNKKIVVFLIGFLPFFCFSQTKNIKNTEHNSYIERTEVIIKEVNKHACEAYYQDYQ